MKLKTTTQDFTPKLKAFLKGYISLRESGIQNVNINLDPLLDDFLYQFEEPTQETPRIPLPPVEITGKSAVAYIARSKRNGATISKTLTTSQWGCALALQDAIPSSDRHNYEIIPLYVND